MLMQTSYRFIAPVYDVFLRGATAAARKRSLDRLPQGGEARVLISGAGTGLDFPHLTQSHQYTALDFTRQMLQRSYAKAGKLKMEWVCGDSMALPFAEATFDVVVLHLIVAVVPEPEKCLAEAVRVLKPGGRILLFDKFLHRGERAWFRKLLGIFSAKIVTRLDVVLEDVLQSAPQLQVVSNEAALAGGWFRLLELKKKTD